MPAGLPVGQLAPTSPRARWVGEKMAEKYEAASRRRSVGPLARRVSTPLSYLLTRSFHLPRSEHPHFSFLNGSASQIQIPRRGEEEAAGVTHEVCFLLSIWSRISPLFR